MEVPCPIYSRNCSMITKKRIRGRLVSMVTRVPAPDVRSCWHWGSSWWSQHSSHWTSLSSSSPSSILLSSAAATAAAAALPPSRNCHHQCHYHQQHRHRRHEKISPGVIPRGWLGSKHQPTNQSWEEEEQQQQTDAVSSRSWLRW